MMKRLTLLFNLMIISMLFASCAAPTPQVIEKVITSAPVEVTKIVAGTPVEVTKIVAGTPVVQVITVTPAPTQAPASKFLTWFQFDQYNMDPKSDERAGNVWIQAAMPAFNEQFDGQWTWDNQFNPWDRVTAKVIAGVMAKAEVPDILQTGGTALLTLYKNGAVTDLTDWVKAQKWYSEMDPSALKVCTAPDGKIYCVPTTMGPSQVYVWKDRFPNGFPKTTDEMLKEGERLKQEGYYAMTFFGNTGFGGDGAGRAVFMTVASFGGGFDDGNGKLKLNTPENVAAIAWLREMVQKGYVSPLSFAGGFQEEQAFMDSSAGSIPTGLFGYRYMNPLTAPSGKKYEKKTSEDMIDAINAGDVYLAPFPAAPGQKPGCGFGVDALFVPTGAKNIEGAKTFINWILSPEANPAYVQGPGGGIPVIKSVAATEKFDTKFYQQAFATAEASNCQVPWQTLTTAGYKQIIINVVYKLIKTDPTADIASELQKAEEEYNKTVK